MIVKMKKVFLVNQAKDIAKTVGQLRDLGVLHVEHFQPPVTEELSGLKEKAQTLAKVIAVLEQEKKPQKQESVDNILDQAEEIEDLVDFVSFAKEEMSKRANVLEAWKDWGDFDPEDIKSLARKGFYVYLVAGSTLDQNQLPEDIAFARVSQKGKLVKGMVVSLRQVSPQELSFQVLPLPPENTIHLKLAQEDSKTKIKNALAKISEAAQCIDCFKEALKKLQEEIIFTEVAAGKRDEGELIVFQGFFPVDRSPALEAFCKKHEWAYLISEPKEEDNVPTLLRNPRWVEFINPLIKLLNIFPGYHELDVSRLLLIFFSIFFAILIGDAGYGLFFIVATLFSQVKWGRKLKSKELFFLLYVLGGATVLWGMMTGLYFGFEFKTGILRPWVPWLKDTRNIQVFCFCLGAVHLSLAHIWRIIVKWPRLDILADLGWLSLLWGMFFAAKMMILQEAFPDMAKWLFIFGPICVVLFSSPQKNILKVIGSGVGALLLNFVNSFTDVVSYIRLYAVGMATFVIADTFNQMVLGLGGGPIFAKLIAVVILLVGHLFNISLGIMAVFVHGLRLNVLEFSNHLGLTWSGSEYRPFSKSND